MPTEDKVEVARLPDRIERRLRTLQDDVREIVRKADALRTTKLPDQISFRIVNGAPSDILTDYERAQSISFVTRFDHLPDDYSPQVAELDDKPGEYVVGNFGYLRHVINDFRPLIQNQDDSVHYHRLHRSWRAMLLEEDPSRGTQIRVSGEHGDVTSDYVRWLDECNKAITSVLKLSRWTSDTSTTVSSSTPIRAFRRDTSTTTFRRTQLHRV